MSFDVELPDGTLIQDVPDGTTKSQLIEKMQKNGMSIPKKWLPKADDPTQPGIYAKGPVGVYKEGSFTEGMKSIGKSALALGEMGLSAATGAAASTAGGVAGAARTAGGLLMGEEMDKAGNAGADVSRKVSAGGTYQPKTDSGKALMNTMGDAMEGVNTAVGSVGGAVGHALGGEKGEQIGRTVGEHAVDAAGALTAVRGLTGMRAATRAAGAVTNVPQMSSAIENMQKEGFRVLPSDANGGVVNHALEAAADQTRTKNLIAKHNVSRAGELVREDIGLGPKDYINEQTLGRVRTAQNAKYDAVSNLNTPVRPDAQYLQEIHDLDKGFREIKDHMPDLYHQPGLERIRAAFSQSQSATGDFTPRAVIDITKEIRSSANKTLKNPNATDSEFKAAAAAKQAASSLESLLERTLQSQGQGQLAAEWKAARETLAKVHDVEASTSMVTGQVDPQKLRRLMNTGQPLSGKLKSIAEAAETAPDVMRTKESTRGNQGVHISDIGTASLAGGAVAAGVSGNLPLAAGLATAALGRPLVRGAVASKVYQKTMARPSKSTPMPAFSMGDVTQAGAGAAVENEASNH